MRPEFGQVDRLARSGGAQALNSISRRSLGADAVRERTTEKSTEPPSGPWNLPLRFSTRARGDRAAIAGDSPTALVAAGFARHRRAAVSHVVVDRANARRVARDALD